MKDLRDIKGSKSYRLDEAFCVGIGKRAELGMTVKFLT